MTARKQQRCLLIGLLAAVFAIPFLPWTERAPGAAFAQSESPQEQLTWSPEAPAGIADPKCSFFTNFQQSRVLAPAGLQRVGAGDASFRRAAQLGAQTEELELLLAPLSGMAGLSGARPVSDVGPWVSRIDYHIFSTLESKNITPANLTADAEFLRRVTLDLTGRIPTAEQVQQFVADTDAQKRTKAIDRLLDSPEWVDRWTMWLGDMLKNSSTGAQINRGIQGRDALHQFIRTSLQYNKPYNMLVSELITGAGQSYVSGPANFIVGGTMSMGPVQDTYDRQWMLAATMFMGLKSFDCILCHDGAGHLDAVNLWGAAVKRSEAWGLAAFFSRTRITRPAGQNTTYVVNEAAAGGYNLNTTSGNRPTRAPVDGLRSPVLPRYLFSGRQVTAGENFRAVLAQELTRDPQFARATVNYLWAHFFGIGIVDPPDNFDLGRMDPRYPPPEPWTIQPSHPELLEELALSFVNNGFSLKEIMREITRSQTYQLSSRYEGAWDPAYTRYQARHLIRRLQSEEMADSIVLSSGVANNMNVALGSGSTVAFPWAMQLPETIVPARGNAVGAFLDTFLRGDRDENDRRGDLSFTQALALMNDSFVINRVRGSTAGTGRLAPLLTAQTSNTQLVQAIYLHALSRYPTEQELAVALQTFQTGTRVQKAQDLLWALYNKVDFIFNY